jgi:hypothetical protein
VQSLSNNVSGSENTAIGVGSLRSIASTSNNTAVGSDALYDSTGSDNTAIGYNTGRGITTGSNNTILGANVTGLSPTLANNIIIADGSGNRRINVDSSGNVGIGTTTPAFVSVKRFQDSSTRPRYELYKSRGTIASPLVIQTGDELGAIEFNGFDGANNQRNAIIYVTAEDVTGGVITPQMAFGLGQTAGLNQYRMVIKNDGNITIGNNLNSLGARLGIKGSGTTSATTSLLVQNSASTNLLSVLDNGNVGIGTNAPSALLNVQNSSNGVLLARFKDNISAATYLDIKTDPTLTDYTALYFGSDRRIMSKQGVHYFYL